MTEQIKTIEKNIILEQEVIDLLNLKGVEDPETKGLLEKYVDQCHSEADAEVLSSPDTPGISNRSNIKADIKIASLYFKTERYKDYGKEALGEAYEAAIQNDSTLDLADEINRLIHDIK